MLCLPEPLPSADARPRVAITPISADARARVVLPGVLGPGGADIIGEHESLAGVSECSSGESSARLFVQVPLGTRSRDIRTASCGPKSSIWKPAIEWPSAWACTTLEASDCDFDVEPASRPATRHVPVPAGDVCCSIGSTGYPTVSPCPESCTFSVPAGVHAARTADGLPRCTRGCP
jgi:hypothetical protein